MSASRGLLRAMTITGITQAASVMLSIARMKVLALLLGPVGVGVLSLFNSLQTTASSFAGLGIGGSAVRQIAQARDDGRELGRVRRVLLGANLIQGLLATTVIWLLRERIATWLFGAPGYETEVGLVGLAVFLTLVGASQTALLRGMRRIGDLGRVTLLGALAGTFTGIAAVWLLGTRGLIWFVLMQPLTAVAVAIYFTQRLPKAERSRTSATEIWQIWKPMAVLGTVFMLGGLATAGTQLLVRGRIASELGLDTAGQFAAAWSITTTYVTFLLNAMSMDYYPRLAEIIHDREAAARLMNEQTQIALAIAGPVILVVIGWAPIAIKLLYSDQFHEAAALLQWQTAGDLFKLASWPLGFAFAAAARSYVFLLVQISFNAFYLAFIWFGLPMFGLEVAGTAFFAAYVLCFVLVYVLARRLQGFRWEPLSAGLICAYTVLSLSVLAISLIWPVLGMGLSAILFAVTGFVGGHIVLEKIGPHRYTAPFARVYAACGWPLSEAA